MLATENNLVDSDKKIDNTEELEVETEEVTDDFVNSSY